MQEKNLVIVVYHPKKKKKHKFVYIFTHVYPFFQDFIEFQKSANQ